MTAIIGWAHSRFGKLEAETLESLIAGFFIINRFCDLK